MNIENIEFWRSLNPQLTISSTPFSDRDRLYIPDQQHQQRLRQQMVEEGYFNMPPFLRDEDVSVLRDTVIKLNDNNIMPLFAAVYDEFWVLMHNLSKTFSFALQDDYRLIPDFWIWHIDAVDQQTGWKPHRDGSMEFDSIRDDGTPTLCTAWIALSDVSAENSCMYVLPRKYDAIFQDFARRRAGQPGIDNANQIPVPLNRIRALPVKAGGVLGWDTNLFHWGSGSSKWADNARMSIGVYYEANDADANGLPYNDSGLKHIDYSDAASQLSFEDRLVIIANIIKNYLHKFDNDGEVEKGFTDEVRKYQDKWCWKP